MAERRMFAKSIIDSDGFLEMPATAQILYFHLSMRADDDGFIGNPKRIMRMIGSGEDDMKLLFNKGYAIPFESGVIVITHWNVNNYLRADRYRETIYQTEKALLQKDKNNAYIPVENQAVYQADTERYTNGIPSIGKDSIGKYSIDNILSTSDNETDPYKTLNFQNIVDSYNSICKSLPKIIKLTEARKKTIKTAAPLIGNDEEFKAFFEKVEASDFLCGRTEKAWTGCGFDWIMKKNNIVKILEGYYDNRTGSEPKVKNGKPDYYNTSRYEDLSFN